MRKASATDPTEIPPINRSEKRNCRPKRPLMAAPASGSRGTSQMYLYISPFQQVDLVYPDRFLVAIESDDDSQTNGRLSSGDDDHKHGEELTGQRVDVTCCLQVTGECHEVQIRGVEYQLDRHEDDDDVAAR